jgi:two-component system phosphate regulon response regulator PhoB
MAETVLVVEDEVDILEVLQYNLEGNGYHVITAKDGPTALEAVRTRKPSIIVLDLMLPGYSGLEVCRRLKGRQETARIPILMLTAKAEESDRVVGLELGADDYVTKPFSPREVTLRVEAILRRLRHPESAECLTFPELQLDQSAGSIKVANQTVSLTVTEFRLLWFLAERPGRLLSRDVLHSEVWGYDEEVTSRTVDTHIKRLRGKLKTAGCYIETVRGMGYRFNPESKGSSQEE